MKLAKIIENRIQEGMSGEEVRLRAGDVQKKVNSPKGQAMQLSTQLDKFAKTVNGKLKKQAKDFSNVLYDFAQED